LPRQRGVEDGVLGLLDRGHGEGDCIVGVVLRPFSFALDPAGVHLGLSIVRRDGARPRLC
jgi:hypothetical protein